MNHNSQLIVFVLNKASLKLILGSSSGQNQFNSLS